VLPPGATARQPDADRATRWACRSHDVRIGGHQPDRPKRKRAWLPALRRRPDQQRRLITPRPRRPIALLARVHWSGPSRTVADPRARTPCDDPAPGLQHVAALERAWGDDLRSPDVRTGHPSTAAPRRPRPPRRSPDYFGYSADGEPSPNGQDCSIFVAIAHKMRWPWWDSNPHARERRILSPASAPPSPSTGGHVPRHAREKRRCSLHRLPPISGCSATGWLHFLGMSYPPDTCRYGTLSIRYSMMGISSSVARLCKSA